MSNVNWIGRKTEDKTYYIYCHWGGDLDQNGQILYDHWNNEEDVIELLDQGDASYIDKTLKECAFYATMQDRDEEKRPPTTDVDSYCRPNSASNYELCFLWTKEEWWVSSGDTIKRWWRLAELMEDEAKQKKYEREVRGVIFDDE